MASQALFAGDGRWSKQYADDWMPGGSRLLTAGRCYREYPGDEAEPRVIHAYFRCDNISSTPSGHSARVSTGSSPLAIRSRSFSYHLMMSGCPGMLGPWRLTGGANLPSASDMSPRIASHRRDGIPISILHGSICSGLRHPAWHQGKYSARQSASPMPREIEGLAPSPILPVSQAVKAGQMAEPRAPAATGAAVKQIGWHRLCCLLTLTAGFTSPVSVGRCIS